MTSTASVVVVSHGRPASLRLCLLALSQQTFRPFELVIVCDSQSQDVPLSLGWRDGVKLVAFDDLNISAARNLGIAQSAGSVVAFIDDDACAEPTWLGRLVAPFSDPAVAASTGYVRGRNGISFQSRAQKIDRLGETTDLPLEGLDPVCLPPPRDGAIKTVGTNCAFRRSALVTLGGFDESFQFFHDETDLNMRLADAGHSTAVVPLAQVHHQVAASPRRRRDRMPLDLSLVGQSQRLFLHKHCPADCANEAWREFSREQRSRLLQHMVNGRCEPGDVDRLLSGLLGVERPASTSVDLTVSQPFLSFELVDPPLESLWETSHDPSGRLAQKDGDGGVIRTVFRFFRSAHFHQIRFVEPGLWLHTGGIWGKSLRNDQIVTFCGYEERIEREWRLVAAIRNSLHT